MTTSEVIGASNEWFFMNMMANDIRRWMGAKFYDIYLTVEETPRKIPQTWKLTRPGFEAGPARWSLQGENALRYLTLKTNMSRELLTFVYVGWR